MDKRSIFIISAAVIVLACFFQFSRMDGFLHFASPKNESTLTKIEESAETDGIELPTSSRETYLIVYDPHSVDSTFARHRLEWLLKQIKKKSVSITVGDKVKFVPQNYRGVLIATGQVGRIKSMGKINDYVEAGGSAALFMHPDTELGDDDTRARAYRGLGIESAGAEVNVWGIRVLTDFIFGGKGYDSSRSDGTWYTATTLTLAPDASIEMETIDGVPLVWQHPYGAGRYMAFNGSVRDDKENIGILMALIAHCGDDAIYPVLGVKLFFIDDFPAPAPEGNYEKIYDELGLSTVDFYRTVWWPYMKDLARRYDLKYTGLIIETYGKQVTGPFAPSNGRQARDNLIVYGRELLDMGGELGLHGYNHQPLEVDGFLTPELYKKHDYVGWPNKGEMVAAMKELYRYAKESYPDYEFRSYVPPSDILDENGHEAVAEAVPTLKVYSSIFEGLTEDKAYYQDFVRNDDGTYEIPRITSGYSPTRINAWVVISLANYIGVFSHFVHPDEIFYEESKDLSWGMMHDSMRAFLDESFTRYPWYRAVTDSECADLLGDYLDMDYDVVREEHGMRLTTRGNKHPLRFILRSNHVVDENNVIGGSITVVADSTYLVETTGSEFMIRWSG